MELVISIDIGGTSTKLALVDRGGVIWRKSGFSTQNIADESDFFQRLYSSVLGLEKGLSTNDEVVGMGISAPSCRSEDGVIVKAANLPFSEEVPIQAIINKRYKYPVSLIKDGNAAALGEGMFGGAKGMKNFIVLTLGTGLGCGIVVNERLVEGSSGQAGELGHVSIDENGRFCGCGKRGCLETYVSATGLRNNLCELLSLSKQPSIFRTLSFNEINSRRIFEAASNGDSIAVESFTTTGKILGSKLAELIALFEPEAIFLAGGLAEAESFIFEPTKMQMEARLLDVFKGRVSLMKSALPMNEAALLGAAGVIWKVVTNQQYTVND